MKSIIKLIASLLLLLFSLPAYSQTLPYKTKEISDLGFYLAYQKNLEINKENNLYFTVSVKENMSQDSHFFAKYIAEMGVKESWKILSWYLDVNGIPKEPCRGSEYNVNIFIVELDDLSDRWRFRDIYNSPIIKSQGGYMIYAYYDPTTDVQNNSMIVISDISDSANTRDIIHEMTHYWWDRLCLSEKLPSFNTESFAKKIEDLYFIYQPK